jgi:ubiquinone/menaquinone biosynthesis C-methylase UbiE
MRGALAARSLPLRPARAHEQEWMDLPGQDPTLVAECLDDLRRLNRLTGGIFLTVRALGRLTRNLAPGADLEIVDLATGGGDFPRAMAGWATRRGLRARILATDLNPQILGLAAHGALPGIEFAVADARRLPFADRSFDVATCSLFLHHLEPDDAVLVLKEMRRVARRGVIVNDLVRSWVGYLGALVIPRAMSENPLFRHDAPLSVRRAYTKGEMTALAARAGLGPVRFHGTPGYRVTMTAGARPS